jgi:hypothetical protein
MSGDDQEQAVDVRSLLAALADEGRLRIFATALLTPAATPAELADRLDTPLRTVARQTGKLLSAGLLTRGPDGGLTAQSAPFRAAVRQIDDLEAAAPPRGGVDRAIDALFRRGRLVDMPVAPALRHRMLEHLVTDFEPDIRYSETEVREILCRRYNDHATLRRYLVDDGLLDRDSHGTYWRP